MISDLLKEYKEALKAKEFAEKMLEIANKELKNIEAKIEYFMEVEGLTELKIDDDILNKITFNPVTFPSVKVEDYERLKEFLGDDVKEVFTETPSKLKSFVKDMLDNGKPIPEFINLFTKQVLKITKKRGTK